MWHTVRVQYIHCVQYVKSRVARLALEHLFLFNMNTNVKLKYISYRILLHLNPLRQRVELLALYVNLTQFHQDNFNL